MEQLSESSPKKILMSRLLMLIRYLWLGVGIILECAMSGICFLGFFYFRKWNDKLMILTFALMFVWWAVISFSALVRARKGKKWVILPQLWMKLILFVGAMTIFYLLAPVYAGAFWMAILTVMLVFLTFYIHKNVSELVSSSNTSYVPMSFRYLSRDKSEWLSAYYLWLAERSLMSEKFYERIGAEMTTRVKERLATPREMFEKADHQVTEADMSLQICDLTRAYFCFGTAESLRMFPYLGNYEDTCGMILIKNHLDFDSAFDPKLFREMETRLDEVYELYQISCEQVFLIDQKTGKPFSPSRVIRIGNREINVYSHLLVKDRYLIDCLEDFKPVSEELQKLFADPEAESEEKESLLFETIRVFPPHGEELVYMVSGRKRYDKSEEITMIVRGGKLYRSGPSTDPDFSLSPWVLILGGNVLKG